MLQLHNFSIGAKLTGAFGLLVVTFLLLVTINALQFQRIDDAVDTQVEQLRTESRLEDLILAVETAKSAVRGLLITGDRREVGHFDAAIADAQDTADTLRRALADMPDQTAQLETALAHIATWRTDFADRQIRLMRSPETVNEARAIEFGGLAAAPLRAAEDTLLALRETLSDRAEQASAAKDRAVAASNLIGLGFGAGAAVLALVFAVGLTRAIARPIRTLAGVMTRLAEGDLAAEIPGGDRRDEIGHMTAAVVVFKQRGQENQSLVTAQADQRAMAERDRIAALNTMADTVETEAVKMTGTISVRSETMAGLSDQMRQSAEKVRMQAGTVASAAQQSLANTNAVAAAGSQLTAAISEIAHQVSTSADVAKQAAETARRTQDIVGSLSEAARKVGDVVDLIADVAEQTNLLALNATIEAARAGDAGKGFAVVASEVKNLAGQTQRATGEISAQVSDMQAITHQAVDAIQSIADVIRDIDERSGGVAATVEQQNAATTEISRNVSQAASSAEEVARRIQEVTDESGSVETLAGSVNESARSVAETASTMRHDLVRIVRTAVEDVDRRKQASPVPVDRRAGA